MVNVRIFFVHFNNGCTMKCVKDSGSGFTVCIFYVRSLKLLSRTVDILGFFFLIEKQFIFN